MEIKTIQLKKNMIENNDRDADILRSQLKKKRTFYMNLMSAPGSGKTTTLISTIQYLQKLNSNLKIGVMEADIDSDVDAITIRDRTGVPTIQLHTGGMCHLDADMSRQGLKEIRFADLDLIFLENVGNLVCPAEFDTGAVKNAVILSVPEGDDKPLKYPLMFTEADVIIVNKTDTLEAFDFDKDIFLGNVHKCNENAQVFFISAKTGEGLKTWSNWLMGEVKTWVK